jgi:hypothetical protein
MRGRRETLRHVVGHRVQMFAAEEHVGLAEVGRVRAAADLVNRGEGILFKPAAQPLDQRGHVLRTVAQQR